MTVRIIAPAHTASFAGINLNIYHANAGEGLPQHDHSFPHLTMCMAGSCEVRKSGKSLVLTPASQPVYLVENEWHEIEALTDGTVFQNVFVAAAY